MTLHNLSKILDKYDKQQLGSADTMEQLRLLRGLPFYNFQNPKDHDTFNHVIGLPKKNGLQFPLFDYEQLLCDSLHKHKHIWIKKATGLGITEFVLRFMAWLCLRDNALQSSQMCIVTGPRIELAITLITRMKQLFLASNKLELGDTKETVMELNGISML
ncbi:MAG: hypothetical protein WA941_19255 [Nitrososphaeraceae archaeon]